MSTFTHRLWTHWILRCLGVLTLLCMALPSSAAVSSIAIQLINPASGSALSGTQFQYQINYTCSPSVPAVPGEMSCDNMVVRVPLGAAVPNPAGWTVANWARSVTLLPPGATFSMSGTDLLITLPPTIPTNGQSSTFQLNLTPPDYVTFNNTSWSLAPSISGSNIQTATAAPVLATATASVSMSLAKRSLTGNVGVIGDEVTYRITAFCAGSDSFYGHLALQSFDLVDTLPNTVTYVSSSPAAVYNAGARTLTWTNLPARCSQPDTNHFEYDVTVRINDGVSYPGTVVANGASIVNPVQSRYQSISEGAPRTATAQHTMTVYHGAPPLGNIVGKEARGFLNATNNNSQGTPTYAGHWLAEAPQPQIWGQAEASFRINISPPPVGYSSELVDPMPCLDNYVSTSTSGTYSSKALAPTTTNLSADPLNNLCQRPAFHPIRFSLSPRFYDTANTTGLRVMYAAGWRPAAIMKDGTRVDLNMESEDSITGGRMWFAIPTAYREQVAMLHLPNHTDLRQFEMAVHGYADPLTDDNINATRTAIRINNTAYSRMHWRGAASFTQSSAMGYFTVIAPTVQVQADKFMSQFYATSTSSGKNYTPIRLWGYVNSPMPVESDVIMTDLLPEGMSLLGYPSATVPATILNTQTSAILGVVNAAIEIIPNHMGSGRELVRLTIPEGTFPAGAYRVSFQPERPPGPFTSQSQQTLNDTISFFVESPIAVGTYTNSMNIYAPDVTLSQICQPTSPSASPPQTTDALNQSGRGTSVSYCQSTATFVRSGQGAAGYTLAKQVQGDLDPAFQPAGTPGHISLPNGSARYRLTWTNTGGQTLGNVVVYDVLPNIGDTSTISGDARGSQFATTLTSLVTPLPSGVTVQYSASTNPCRPEVYATQPVGCASDWTSNPATLGGLANVRALRYSSSQSYASGQAFSLEMNVSATGVLRGQLANNNAASRASLGASPMLPAESPIGAIRGTDDGQLQIGKTVDQATARSGDTLTYTVTVRNTGPLPAIGIQVSDTLPEHTGFVSATGNGVHDAAATGGNITWTMDLAPGATASFTVVATVQGSAPAGSTLTNSVGVTNPATGPFLPPVVDQACPEPLATRSCASTQLPTAANITLSKEGPATVGAGRALSYTIALGNSGETQSGTTLTVTEKLPAGVAAQTVVPGNNVQTVSCLPALPQTGTTLTCTLTLAAPLAAGSANGAATIRINALAPLVDGALVNYASVDPTGGSTPPEPGLTCAPESSCGSVTTQVATSKLEPIPASSPLALALMGLALGWFAHYENRRRRRER
ncbi:DUF11 domain-containing protein [Ottowia thiooxydans]|uniref:Repeat protein (TIGR01451 family) n=1 Tax=Ottowia thiooxydans TaxID=219182 RepID=A0ABV2QCK0_9BURK